MKISELILQSTVKLDNLETSYRCPLRGSRLVAEEHVKLDRLGPFETSIGVTGLSVLRELTV